MKFQLVCWYVIGAAFSLFLPLSGYSHPSNSQDVGYPASLWNQLHELHQASASLPDNADLLIRLASIYLDVGDDLYHEGTKRLEAYQAGADFAKQALALDPQNAEAHFLYAANLGLFAQLKGVFVSAFRIHEIKRHVEQAIDLDPDHAPALHMMGMILDGLPWFLGGDGPESLAFLERAVVADPSYSHARLNLGKLYLKHDRARAGMQQLVSVTKIQSPRSFYSWFHHHNPEALRLLKELGAGIEGEAGL